MKKKALAVLLAVVMVLALSACSVSSRSTTTTSVSTSVTENGNTTTNTVTNETGVSAGTDGVTANSTTTTETTTEPASGEEGTDYEAIAAGWRESFIAGGRGTSEHGDDVFFAFNDPANITYGIIMDISNDGEHMMAYQGEIVQEDDHLVLNSDTTDQAIEFTLEDAEGDDFVMTFLGDGDVATLTAEDIDTLIDEMIGQLAEFM